MKCARPSIASLKKLNLKKAHPLTPGPYLLPLKPTKFLFRPVDDVQEKDYSRSLGEPGEYPFTRGIQKDMYRGRLWTMRQYAGFGSAEDSNRRYRYLLSKGTTGLSVAFD